MVAELKPPAGAWYAVIVVVPTPTGVTVVPEAVATLELEEEKLHAPVLFDVGGVSASDETLSFAIVTLVNEPMVGFGAVIVRVAEVLALFQSLVAN